MRILLLADHDGRMLTGSTRNALTAAHAWPKAVIEALVCGYQVEHVAEQAAQMAGISGVWLADAPHLKQPLLEDLCATLAVMAEPFTVVLAPHRRFFASTLARYAAQCGLGMVQDVLAVVAPNTYVRLRHAGVATEVVCNHEPRQVLTVRASRFASAGCGPLQPIHRVEPPPSTTLSRRIRAVASGDGDPRLQDAHVIVTGGRALGARFFPTLQPLATALGAELGATRGAVDSQLAPRNRQVGQTGVRVEPALYLAVGASGAIQHQAGMRNSKTVIAINSDPDAPIFGIADYGLVGDLFEVVPQLLEALDHSASASHANHSASVG
jgi:electron transfer flavoprotein alpha subunit